MPVTRFLGVRAHFDRETTHVNLQKLCKVRMYHTLALAWQCQSVLRVTTSVNGKVLNSLVDDAGTPTPVQNSNAIR